MVRLIESGQWATIGGGIEPDESPAEAALREAEEEAGITLRLGPIVAVLGGPEYRVTYANGDRAAYVVTAFEAEVVGGAPRPDQDETSAVEWWEPERLPSEMSPLTRALLRDCGI